MSLSAQLPALQVVVPLASAPLVTLLRVANLPWLVALAASATAFAISIALTGQVLPGTTITYDLGGWPAPYGIVFVIDQLSCVMMLIVTGASTAALAFGKMSLDLQIGTVRAPYFYAAWLLALAGLVGISITGDAFNIFVFMEISSLASYVLIGSGPDRRALTATFKYLTLGTIGATFYLIGVGLIYMMTGTLNLADMASRVGDVSDLRPVLAAAGFVTIGLALKAAIFPLHVWMPNAYTFAPHIVSVFLAACATKVSLYVLIRFDSAVFAPNLAGHDIRFSGFLTVVSILAVLIGSTVAVFENNLKRLLGYSSVAQIGYILLGVSFLSLTGMTAGVVHLFNHALIKAALFMAVACIAYRLGTVRLNEVAGCGKIMPWTMAAFVAAGLSLIGVPGTAGFVSKWYLLQAALDHGPVGYAIAAVILVSSVLAVIYVWKVIEWAYFREFTETSREAGEAPVTMLIFTWAMVLANFYFGIFTELPLGLAESSAKILLGAGL